jgi:hypothetical protein
VWTGLAANGRQVFRNKVKGSEDHRNGAEKIRINITSNTPSPLALPSVGLSLDHASK